MSTRKTSLSKHPRSAQITSSRTAPDVTGATKMEVIAVLSAALTPAVHYLTNNEAATFLKLSPRTLEKQRVIGGGPRFHKFGRRVVYAIEDLEAWAQARVCTSTSDAPSRATR